jgi:RNA polymerase sigma-70 factor (ECF subfamily)
MVDIRVAPPKPTESSWRLLERARGGDSEALERLYERYAPRLRRWARGRLPGPARELLDTDDVVQEAMIQTLKHVSTFDPEHPSSFQAYLRRAIINKIRNEMRRTSRRPVIEAMTGEELGGDPSPLDIAAGREISSRYREALARLSEDDQEAIVARVEMGCSYAEVADLVGKSSEDSARMALGRALLRLAKEMKRDGWV